MEVMNFEIDESILAKVAAQYADPDLSPSVFTDPHETKIRLGLVIAGEVAEKYLLERKIESSNFSKKFWTDKIVQGGISSDDKKPLSDEELKSQSLKYGIIHHLVMCGECIETSNKYKNIKSVTAVETRLSLDWLSQATSYLCKVLDLSELLFEEQPIERIRDSVTGWIINDLKGYTQGLDNLTTGLYQTIRILSGGSPRTIGEYNNPIVNFGTNQVGDISERVTDLLETYTDAFKHAFEREGI